MDFIEFLGSAGSRSAEGNTTCIRIGEHTTIDAGNLMIPLENATVKIKHVLLTHAHMDHLCDLPFLVERHAADWNSPLKVYGTQATLRLLATHIFNDGIWPDFRRIRLEKSGRPCMEFIEITPEKSFEIDGIRITPIPNNHAEGSCGFLLKKSDSGILISSDTYLCDSMIERLNRDKEIRVFCVDISFPSDLGKLAEESRHLTPLLLQKMLEKLRRPDLSVYTVHLKSPWRQQIARELLEYRYPVKRVRIVSDRDRIYYLPPEHDLFSVDSQFSANPLEEISDASLAISNERNIDRLLELILSKARKLTHSDGGTLYLLNKEKKSLEFKVVQNESLHISMGGASGEPIRWEALPLYTPDGDRNTHMAAVAAAFEERAINIADVYHAKSYDFSGTKTFDEHTGYRSQSMLILPLKNHENNLIGILQLINKVGTDGTVISYSRSDENIAMILATQAAIVLTKQQFIAEMEQLFESFLHAIIIAIENKSKYTAGHIQKMVAITSMLVDAIDRDQNTFADIRFSDDEKKEIILAAMMHDVGKIVVPEYIVDKATRLQTLCDRIENIRIKAELRRHEALIDFLKRKCTVDETEAQNDPEYLSRLEKIEKDLALAESLNSSTRPLENGQIETLKKIAHEKIVLEGKETDWLTNDEMKNLSIRQGTLTDEERKIINSHAYIGMKMLQEVRFPEKYSRVPQIASAHHEKLDGSGYPLGLKDGEISLEARILAIADIFEALTAADRPYKTSKTAESAMRILEEMAEKGELDGDIVSFLRTSGLYLEIDRKILSPSSSVEADDTAELMRFSGSGPGEKDL